MVVKYTDALLINYITQYITSILFDMTHLNLNNFMSGPNGVQSIHSSWQWTPGTILDLNQFPQGREFFGAFDYDSIMEIPVWIGVNEYPSAKRFDSYFEKTVAKSTFEFDVGDYHQYTVPIGHPDSPYTDIYAQEIIRHWSNDRRPFRQPIDITDPNLASGISHMFYDLFLQLKEGRAWAIEADGMHNSQYITKKDLNTYSYLADWNIPIINVVLDRYYDLYVDSTFFMGHISPLLSQTEWNLLNWVLMLNAGNQNLEFEELMADLWINYEDYEITQEMAQTLQEKFGMDISGNISPDFMLWWHAFRTSNQQMNGAFINMFWLHAH